jgi:hypothetical protein
VRFQFYFHFRGFEISPNCAISLPICTIAKRAYLQTIHSPPTAFTSPTSATIFQIKPYDGPDAQIVIHTVNSRRGNNARQGSISVSSSGSNLGIPAVQAHGRNPSVPATQGKGDTGSIGRNGWKNGNGSNGSINPLNVNNNALGFVGREPSPTLPNIPAHPTLNSLINSTLSEMSPQSSSDAPSLPSLSPPAPSVPIVPDERGTPPKIGDPAKRMVGHALGVKHPGIAPRASGGNNDLQKAMSGLTIAE